MKKSATRTIEQIDAEIAKLSDERRTLSEKLYGKSVKEGKNRYFRGVPKNPGVYHYSNESCAVFAGAMGYWDGRRWHSIAGWGDFTNRGSPIVWHGEGRTRKQPLSALRLREENIDPSNLAA